MTFRELTKGMNSLWWAMTLFPLHQSLNILDPSKATEAFNKVTEATRGQFGGALDATFRAGDNLQKGLVDATFSLLSLQALNPNTWIRTTSNVAQQAAKAGSDVAQQAVGTLGQVMPGATGGSQSQSTTGWGPVPNPSSGGRCSKS